MKNRSAMRRQGFKLNPLTTISVRIEPEIYARCDWAAAARGIRRSEFIRNTLARATEDAKPPKQRESRGLDVAGEQWAEWEEIASRRGHTAESFIHHLMAYYLQQDFERAAA